MAFENNDAASVTPRMRALSSLVLYGGFSLTGAATVLLGVVLPTLTAKWGLHDNSAGFLFTLQFLGSSLGAICTGSNRVRSLGAGYGLLTLSSCGLAFAGLHVAFVLFFLFGLGLGMAMTATSLVFSDRFGDERAAKLERLNFAWAAGATTAPMLFVPFLDRSNLQPLFFIFEGLFLLLFLWVFFLERQVASSSAVSSGAEQPQVFAPLRSLLPLVVLAMCAVGTESALSGWLTTYSHRADPLDISGAALATSIFWLGIMLSRLVASTALLAKVGRHRMLVLTMWGAAISVTLLIFAHHVPLIRVAAALAGISVGPLYPLILSFLLERSPRGWIFAAGGLGSAIFPWLTGMLSAHFGSLHYGLIAPCCAALLMILLRRVSLRPPGAPGVRAPFFL